MPQRTFDDGFYHASRARDIAVGNGSGNTNALTEINFLQVDIDTQAKAGDLQTEVTGVTVMTTADNYDGVGTSSHYDAWADLSGRIKAAPTKESELRRAAIEMERVIAYFTRLGYTIRREQDGTNNILKWAIRW